ncbi:hypothetical protein [Actinomadura fibrosa]|uniref:DUF3311 domain-containing protein n=1 Tax=Actinomadura fibrosa TaxID=111802 RepID=A0ABW2XLC7_9ACTN|nr:hypothetical protein [Actinomadura fibrosa]
MTPRTRAHPSAVRRPGPVRRLAVRLWANRPTWGALAFLLAGPGVAKVVLGWPLWWTAAGQWSLWALLLVTVSIVETRRPAPPRGEDGGRSGDGEEADR